MMKKTIRGIMVAGALTGLLALAGCSSIDTSAVTSRIESANGVQAATVQVSHPGAPWNTKTLVTLFIPDKSEQSIATAIRSATDAIAGTSAAKHDVSFFVIPGRPSDYPDLRSTDPELKIPRAVFTGLGLDYTPGTIVALTPADIQRIAAEK
ncbi:hypothetical protein [Humibacter albus]|jgi:hypothetical protein|uniref:hypothetical protein n=1 Tax=Humibacter albus TaxID=427754 RepID=UPI00040959E5|nr:hypothetical protein [Humibacter albus]